MRLTFCPPRGLFLFFLVFIWTLAGVQADSRKPKAAAAEKTKSRTKSAPKTDPKQQAKSARETQREKAEREKQLARKKKDDDDKGKKKRGKQDDKLAAKQHDEKNAKAKGREKDNLSKRERDKQNEKEKLAKRTDDKKPDKSKDRLSKREEKRLSDKKSLAAKQSALEKETKPGKQAKDTALALTKEKSKAKTYTELVEAREKSTKAEKQERNAKAEAKGKDLARSAQRQEAGAEDVLKDLPPGRFTLRPIAKAVPKVELKFNVARANALTSFDAPPPRETGPDVIDVIEHNAPGEAKRLDELVRSEMKTPSVSSVPSVSHKKLDVGKMDSERIRQIQEALAKKGYYAGEISGEYNEATIAAMRKFQEEHKVDVTGYATAQSLKLLGLTDW